MSNHAANFYSLYSFFQVSLMNVFFLGTSSPSLYQPIEKDLAVITTSLTEKFSHVLNLLASDLLADQGVLLERASILQRPQQRRQMYFKARWQKKNTSLHNSPSRKKTEIFTDTYICIDTNTHTHTYIYIESPCHIFLFL